MTGVPVVRTVRARQDIEQATAYYLAQAGPEVALKFIHALQSASSALAEHPHVGSPRYAHALNVPGLQHRRLSRFPWILFYIASPDRVEVVRVLDGRRDIPATLMDDGPA